MFSRFIHFFSRFEYIISVFQQRSRFLWNIGIAVIVFSAIFRIIKKNSSKNKHIESIYKAATLIGIGMLFVSLLGGEGIWIGFGGNGKTIGTGAEQKSEVGQAITDDMSLDADIIIRVCWTNISIDNDILSTEELYDYLCQEYKDQYVLAIIEEYAENETFESVVDAVQRLAIPKYRIITKK